MHPELFHFHLFGLNQTIYTYAFCIVVGTMVAALFTKWRAKKELERKVLPNHFFYLIFIVGFIGGKLFFYLENPAYYWVHPDRLGHNFSGGFVFYGSFISIIPFLLWYLNKNKWPVWPMLDILAFTTLIVHTIGRMGCFFGGCCYGKPTDGFTGIVFPKTNGVAVHPTQLYEVSALLFIIFILYQIKKRQQFDGQIFMLYLMLYAVARNIIELFRGDTRGFVIDGILSHSQFIGILIFMIAAFYYQKLKSKQLKFISYENN